MKRYTPAVPLRGNHYYSEAERRRAAERGGWNVFKFPAKLLLVDLLTDSGTTKLTAYQRSQMEKAHGRETYAGSEGYFLLLRRIEDAFGIDMRRWTIFLFHQGRRAGATPFVATQAKPFTERH